jgi:hypothetical protein
MPQPHAALSGFHALGRGSQDRKNIVLAEDEEFIPFDHDIRSGILSEYDSIANIYIERYPLSVVRAATCADGDYPSFLRLFFRSVRYHDASGEHLFLVDAFGENTVIERLRIHSWPLLGDGAISAPLSKRLGEREVNGDAVYP